MRIRALSVFEGVVYHCHCVDPTDPGRPRLEIEAVVGPGDVDGGPILLPWADYVHMAGTEAARRARPALADAGRLVDHLGVTHLAFPLWEARELTPRGTR